MTTPSIKDAPKVGDRMQCFSSASPGYKVGETYTVEANHKGVLGLTGSDGYFDPLSLLVSGFKKVDLNEAIKRKEQGPPLAAVG